MQPLVIDHYICRPLFILDPFLIPQTIIIHYIPIFIRGKWWSVPWSLLKDLQGIVPALQLRQRRHGGHRHRGRHRGARRCAEGPVGARRSGRVTGTGDDGTWEKLENLMRYGDVMAFLGGINHFKSWFEHIWTGDIMGKVNRPLQMMIELGVWWL